MRMALLLQTGASEQRWSVLAEASEDVGCAHFDALLFEHFSSQIESKHGEKVERGSRRGHRLMGAVERVRKLLSTMGEASATAENLTEGVDVNIKLSREELAELIAPLIARLKGCFVSVLEAEAVATLSLDGVEAVGGGMRMPVVQVLLAAGPRNLTVSLTLIRHSTRSPSLPPSRSILPS